MNGEAAYGRSDGTLSRGLVRVAYIRTLCKEEIS